MDPDEIIRLAREPGDQHRQALLQRATPTDAAQPAAREWLRRWRPRKMTIAPPACGCAAGRCAVCN